ncbi:MAG: DUF3137 domain-containing protein [Acidobacteriota bacterium]|nr:DUF3137 domain-containing protein [Acidobacteriota bacterium]
MTDDQETNEFFREFRHELWREMRRHFDLEKRCWDGEAITVRHGPFAVALDVHARAAGYSSHVVTRLRAPYINRDGFRFRIKRRSFMSSLATILGAQDIEVGDEVFDREFVVEANSSSEMKRLLQDNAIRGQMLALPVTIVEVRDDEGRFGPEFPGEVDELYMACEGRITDTGQIEGLYELFADILNRLCRIGSAYRNDPHLSL